jgi:hypothetical protein
MKTTRICCEFCNADDVSGDELIGLVTDAQGYLKIEEELELAEIHICRDHEGQLLKLLTDRNNKRR